MSDGTVYDLGYTPHLGERLGRAGAIRAIMTDGARRALGLRRSPWSKVLPWALIAAAIIPAAWVVALTYLIAGFSLEDAGPFGDPARFFDVIGTLALLFMALVGPTLLIPDRQYGVLSIYASRPVRASDYLLARAATLVLLTFTFMMIPHLILYLGISSLYVDGIWAGLLEHGAKLPKTAGTALAYVFGYGAPAFFVSLFVRRVAMATGVYVVVMFMTDALSSAIPRSTELWIFKVLAPFSLFSNPRSVRNWLFEVEGTSLPLDRVGFPSSVGALAILLTVVITAAVAVRRYRSEF